MKWKLIIALILIIPDNSGRIKVFSDASSQKLRCVFAKNGRAIEFALK